LAPDNVAIVRAVLDAWNLGRLDTVIRIEQFRERADALEAVGLPEQDAHADS
jgi:hypothetical protein